MEEMKDVTHTHQTPNLRYGRLITLLAQSWGIDVSVGDIRPTSVVFSSRNISLMKLSICPPEVNPKRGRSSGIRIQEPTSAPDAETDDEGDDTEMRDATGRAAPHSADMSSGQSQVLEALYDKVERLGHQFESLSTRNEERWDRFEHQFESLSTRNEERWDRFQYGFEQTMAHYFGPMGRPPPPQSFFTYHGSGYSQQPGSSQVPGPSQWPSSSQEPSSSQQPDPYSQDPSSWDSWHDRQFQHSSHDPPSWP